MKEQASPLSRYQRYGNIGCDPVFSVTEVPPTSFKEARRAIQERRSDPNNKGGFANVHELMRITGVQSLRQISNAYSPVSTEVTGFNGRPLEQITEQSLEEQINTYYAQLLGISPEVVTERIKEAMEDATEQLDANRSLLGAEAQKFNTYGYIRNAVHPTTLLQIIFEQNVSGEYKRPERARRDAVRMLYSFHDAMLLSKLRRETQGVFANFLLEIEDMWANNGELKRHYMQAMHTPHEFDIALRADGTKDIRISTVKPQDRGPFSRIQELEMKLVVKDGQEIWVEQHEGTKEEAQALNKSIRKDTEPAIAVDDLTRLMWVTTDINNGPALREHLRWFLTEVKGFDIEEPEHRAKDNRGGKNGNGSSGTQNDWCSYKWNIKINNGKLAGLNVEIVVIGPESYDENIWHKRKGHTPVEATRMFDRTEVKSKGTAAPRAYELSPMRALFCLTERENELYRLLALHRAWKKLYTSAEYLELVGEHEARRIEELEYETVNGGSH